MIKKTVILIVFAAILLITACAPSMGVDSEPGIEQTKNQDGYYDISVDQLNKILKDKDFLLVNVHIPYEGEIPQTDIFIPFDEIAEHLDQLSDKDESIVLYCQSGNMSTTAAKQLVKLGYTRVYELDGGFNAWRAAGHDLLLDQ